ncbi:sensor domain-containing diguanylate cyclase [Photobacterium sanctipauli]|uniref:diguanylate cyclase n=1 Tax=Photobacterium sanctipauli TaxID=1342794 RepID=A0A2T3P0B7_9GAMM|nr:diguanylate cyclase [Photobacterium sanctipauli]PSW21919.1 sensor domain-containing diguanylate cyclase [Photobacterium sanctipauli]
MNTEFETGLEQLVAELTNQANMERWCHCLLSTLQKELKLDYITFMVEHKDETSVLASWVNTDFKFYFNSLRFDDYNGVPYETLAQVKQSGQTVCTFTDKPYKAIWHEASCAWCQLLLPIKMNNRQVGYLYIETQRPECIDDKLGNVEQVLDKIASDLSVRVLQQEVLDQHLTRRSVEAELEVRNHSINAYLSLLQRLHDVTLQLSKAESLEELYKNAVALGRQYLEIDRMAVFLTDFAKNEMTGTYGTDPDGNLVSRRSFSSSIPDHPLVNEALSRKDHVVVKENAPLYYGTNQVGTGWNAMIAMWNGDNCIGWVAADNLINQRTLTEHQREILKLFGAALGQQIVIKRNHEELSQLNAQLEARVSERTQELLASNQALAKANQQLERWSMQDGLTGIANRRFFDLTLKRYWNKAIKKQVPLSVIMVDVDYFKSFNDQYGHMAGDTCLRKIAATLEKVAKRHKSMLVSRFGGEEFACLIPKSDSEVIKTIAGEMLEAVFDLSIRHIGSKKGRVTISLGCHSLQPNSQSKEKMLIDSADKALYQAKMRGRNQMFQTTAVN